MPQNTPHYEEQYLDLMRRIWTEGVVRGDRTGTGTKALFGQTMRFELGNGAIPLLTTKRVYWKTATRELLWFLTGDTNIRSLVAQKVHIWTDWPMQKYVEETGDNLSRDEFEARILADDDFATKWGDLALFMASSGWTGRYMMRWRGKMACIANAPRG